MTNVANPDFPVGLAMRYVLYEVAGGRLGVLPDAMNGTWTAPRLDTPTLTLSYPANGLGVRGPALDRSAEIAIELSYDGQTWTEPPNARFISQSSEWDPLGDGSDNRNVELIHIGNRLEQALVWSVPAEAKAKDGKYKFNSKNAGSILKTLWDAASKRGWGKDLRMDFSATLDSAGQAWATITTLAFDPSATLLQVLKALMNMGMIDYRWQGRTLQVYNSDAALGRDNQDVIWRLDGNTRAPEKRDWSALCTHVLVKGEEGKSWVFENKEAPAGLPRTEKVVEAGGVELEDTARAVARATLASGANAQEEVKREWEAASVQWLPYLDYQPGDWIRVERSYGSLERMRIVQTSVSVTETGRVSGHTTFGTALDDILSRIVKQQKGITGAASSAGNLVRPDTPSAKHLPRAPEGLVVNSVAVIRDDGTARANVTLGWSEVSTDKDGVAVDVTGYEIAYRQLPSARGPLYPVPQGTSAQVGGLGVGTRYAFSVRAVSPDGGGAWSAEVEHRTATDTTPPPRPSRPVLTQTLGVLGVYWDGLGAQRQKMPADYSHTEVSVVAPGLTPQRFTDMPSPTQRTNIAGLEIREWEVALRTVDRSGNASAWSESARITLEQNIDADAIARKVEEKLAAGDALQRAARAETLKEMNKLTSDMTQVALSLVETGPYPPDAGVVDKTQWVSPDARIFVLKKRGD